MNAPPATPHDPIARAAGSLRLLGILSALFGVAVIFAGGYFNRYERFRVFFIGIGSIIWFIPGIVELAAASMLHARHRWAAALGVLVTFLQLVAAAILFALQFSYSPISPVPVILSALWSIALLRTIGEVHRGGVAIQTDAQTIRGFELLDPSENRAPAQHLAEK